MDDHDLDVKAVSEGDRFEIPPELPILPLRDTVIFPFIVSPLIIARPKSISLINDVLSSGTRILGLVAQKNADQEEPEP